MDGPQVPDPEERGGSEQVASPRGAHASRRLARFVALLRPAATRSAHRWGFGAFFLAELVFVLSSVFIAAGMRDPHRASSGFGPAILFAMVVPTVLAAGVGVVATFVRGNGPRLDLGLRWSRSDVTTGLAVGFAGLVLTTIAATVWMRWMGPMQARSTVDGLLGGMRLPPVLAVLMFLHVWLVSPLCEEVLYRGLLWGAMERLRWSQLAAFVASTAIFAVAHLEPSRTPLLLIIAVPIGVARLLTGRLTASVIAHQVNNFAPALGLLLVSLGLMPA